MPTNFGSAEAAAREAKSADRGEGQSVGEKGTEQPHLYIVHNADSAQPAQQPPGVDHPPTPVRAVKPEGVFGPTLQGQIGRMLRDVFSDVSEEPVPDRFIRLLEALEAKEKRP